MKKIEIFFKAIFFICLFLSLQSCQEEEIDMTRFEEYDWSKIDEIEFAHIPAGYFKNWREKGTLNGVMMYDTSATFILDDYKISKKKITVGQFCIFLNTMKPEVHQFPAAQKLIHNGQDIAIIKKGWDGPYLHIDYSEGIFIPEIGYENVSVDGIYWNGANEFCKWAGYKLPTMKEWEYAANNAKSDDFDLCKWSEDNKKNNYKNWKIEDLIKENILFQNSYGLNDIFLYPWEWINGSVEEEGSIEFFHSTNNIIPVFSSTDTIHHSMVYKKGEYKILKLDFFHIFSFDLYMGYGLSHSDGLGSFRVCK